jgi:hypothetical protein
MVIPNTLLLAPESPRFRAGFFDVEEGRHFCLRHEKRKNHAGMISCYQDI